MAWIPRQRQTGAGRNYFKIAVPIAQKYPGEIQQLVPPGEAAGFVPHVLGSIPLPALPLLLHAFLPRQ